ncbi:hypothetical protein [Rhodococcus sp. NPDC003348]
MSTQPDTPTQAPADSYESAVAAARSLRRLLDPQVRLTPEQRKDTETMSAAVDASNRNRAVINQAIRRADQLVATLRNLEHLDGNGMLYAGLLCVSQAADDLTESIEALERRLLPLVDAATPAPRSAE